MHIDRPAAEVYAYAADPANLPSWAAGLADAAMTQVDGVWIASSPMGPVEVAFAPTNDYGVLDHEVRLPDGEVVLNPMRVVPEGEGAEVVFTLRRRGMSDAEFDADAATVRADLARLRTVLTEG